MGKLKAPLMSLGASGALGKTLVFFPWKGLDVVREYVVPANPKTDAQEIQRGYLRACVAAIHAAQIEAANPLDGVDQSAYALLGSLQPTPRTWFNSIVKVWLDCKVKVKKPVIYRDGTISDTSRASFDCIMYLTEETAGQLAAGKFYFGTSKTNLIRAVLATVTGSTSVKLTNENLSAWMVAGVKYFMQFRPDVLDPSEFALSGIYTFVAT